MTYLLDTNVRIPVCLMKQETTMNRMFVRSRVGADGVLRVTLPIGKEDAGQEVQVTVESLSPKPALTPDEYVAWVESLAGTWKGDFQRPPQGEFEQRDAL